MLRIEKGFDDSLFETSNAALKGYTNHHRLVLPAIAAYDMFHAGHSSYETQKKLDLVLDGTLRTATLAFEGDNVRDAARNVGWVAIRDEVVPDIAHENPWRVVRRDDGHVNYPGVNVWAATRSLLKLPVDAPDERSTRVRERYTFTATEAVCEADIRGILQDNLAMDDVMVATATVYAINKLVPKPILHRERLDMSKYPALSQNMQRL